MKEVDEFYERCLELSKYYKVSLIEEDPLALIFWKNLLEYWKTGVSKPIRFTAI